MDNLEFRNRMLTAHVADLERRLSLWRAIAVVQGVLAVAQFLLTHC